MGNFILGGGSKSLNKGGLLTCRGRQVLPLSFTLQPQAKTVDEYALATFSCEVTGGVAPYSYQWKKNGTNVGTNSANLSVTAAAADNGASITVVVTDSVGTVITSNSVVLGVTSYSYRYDGLSMYGSLDSEISVSSDFELQVKATIFSLGNKNIFTGTTTTGKSGYFSWDNDDRFVIRVDGNWKSTTSPIAKTTGTHVIKLFRIANAYFVSLNGGAMVSLNVTSASIFYVGFIARAFGSSSYQYNNGYVDSVKLWTGGNSSTGNLVFDNHLNNKSTGATQAAVVGPNATIINYNAAGWTVI